MSPRYRADSCWEDGGNGVRRSPTEVTMSLTAGTQRENDLAAA